MWSKQKKQELGLIFAGTLDFSFRVFDMSCNFPALSTQCGIPFSFPPHSFVVTLNFSHCVRTIASTTNFLTRTVVVSRSHLPPPLFLILVSTMSPSAILPATKRARLADKCHTRDDYVRNFLTEKSLWWTR